MTTIRPTPGPLPRRLFAIPGVVALAGALFIVDANVAAVPARASEYCSNADDASMDAETSTRWSRVRTRACLDFQRGQVVAKAVGQTDKPNRCDAGYPPACETRVAKGRAEYHWVEVTVRANGRLYEPCRWDEQGAHDRAWICTAHPIPDPPGNQEFLVEAQTCVDVKDDGNAGKCTAWAALHRIG